MGKKTLQNSVNVAACLWVFSGACSLTSITVPRLATDTAAQQLHVLCSTPLSLSQHIRQQQWEMGGGGIWPGTLYRHIVSLLMASLIKLQVVLQKELRSAAGSREREGESQRGVLDPPELLSKSSLDLEFKTAGCFKALSLSPWTEKYKVWAASVNDNYFSYILRL